jgi:adenosine deaminase
MKKLPKSDLHRHIGSCMTPDVIGQTAVAVLAERAGKEGETFSRRFENIVKFLLPVAADPFLCETNESGKDGGETEKYKKSFGLSRQDIARRSILQVVTDAYALRVRNIRPEKALLDPQDRFLEDISGLLPGLAESPYFSQKAMLRQLNVQYDEVMLVLVLLIYIRDHFDDGDRPSAIKSLGGKIVKLLSEPLTQMGEEKYRDQLTRHLGQFVELWEDRSISQEVSNAFKDLSPTKSIIRFLQSAHSPQRCLGDGNSSLFNYLRGCEYGGSQNLQTRAAIFITVKSIVQSAIEENIRYLCLRAAVVGYEKFQLQSAREAAEALLKAIGYFTSLECDKGIKIHINVIMAANRQRNHEDFTKNADLALAYKDGIAQWTEEADDVAKAGNARTRSYFPAMPCVVSFDLFGLEKGNRPTKFKEQFRKLQQHNFPATIHAGEDDDADAIAEAVYEAFTLRVGHGLSLRQNEGLMRMVRERHIAIELCPISNLLTSGRYGFPDIKDGTPDASWDPKGSSSYPLRQYLNENLDVTINTDNPVVSASDLTQEYIVAARLAGGLTKWEVLRLIKNGFRAAAIPKEEKRKLMNEIDDEIFEILLNEDQA